MVLRPMPSRCAASMRRPARGLERGQDQLGLELARQRVPDLGRAGVEQRARLALEVAQPAGASAGAAAGGGRRGTAPAASAAATGAAAGTAPAARLRHPAVRAAGPWPRPPAPAPSPSASGRCSRAGARCRGSRRRPAAPAPSSEMRLASTPRSLALFCRNEARQHRDVVAPLAQRRQAQADDVQAVEQVLAERALRAPALRGSGAWRRSRAHCSSAAGGRRRGRTGRRTARAAAASAGRTACRRSRRGTACRRRPARSGRGASSARR